MRLILLLIFISAGLSAPSYAITDQERSVLQRLHAELEAIAKITVEAQQAANRNDRHLVDYQLLNADLEKIRQGILDAVNAQRREPRSLPPVSGDYR